MATIEHLSSEQTVHWEYDPTDHTSGAPEAVWEGGRVIARVEDVGGCTRSNGYILAAAHDLLCAAEAIAASPYGIALGDLERLEAAIAKARGENT